MINFIFCLRINIYKIDKKMREEPLIDLIKNKNCRFSYIICLHNSTPIWMFLVPEKHADSEWRHIFSLVIAKVSASVILYDTFKIPHRAAYIKHRSRARLIHF